MKFTKIPLLLLFCVWALCLPSLTWSTELLAGTYDETFQRHWTRYLSEYNYRWGIAQCYQESLLDPRAISGAGAMGLCQFMPKTFEECKRSLRLPSQVSPYHPQVSIHCNAWYMRRQVNIWTTKREPLEKLNLGLASYNAGAGNILKAQKKCQGVLLWSEIQNCLPLVTGNFAKETITYVKRIHRWYGELVNENASGSERVFSRIEHLKTNRNDRGPYWCISRREWFLRRTAMGKGRSTG